MNRPPLTTRAHGEIALTELPKGVGATPTLEPIGIAQALILSWLRMIRICTRLGGVKATPASGHPQITLSDLPLGQPARIVRTADAAGVAGAAGADRAGERGCQLAEIGFLPGERVAVLARAWPGGDPLVVGVGPSRFALRRAEAACVEVAPVPGPEA